MFRLPRVVQGNVSSAACGAVVFANGGPNAGPFTAATVETIDVMKEGYRSASVDARDKEQSFLETLLSAFGSRDSWVRHQAQVNQQVADNFVAHLLLARRTGRNRRT